MALLRMFQIYLVSNIAPRLVALLCVRVLVIWAFFSHLFQDKRITSCFPCWIVVNDFSTWCSFFCFLKISFFFLSFLQFIAHDLSVGRLYDSVEPV